MAFRTLLALALLFARAPFLQAQFTVSLRGGVHEARSLRPDRFLVQSPNDMRMETSRGEVPAVAVEAGTWLRSGPGLFVEILASRNTRWRGFTPLPIPVFHTTTVFANLRVALRTSPSHVVSAEIHGGPTAVVHLGSGHSELTRAVDPGVNAGMRGRVRLREGLSVDAGLYNITYLSTYARTWTAEFTGALGSFDATLPPGSTLRNEMTVLLGVSWSP